MTKWFSSSPPSQEWNWAFYFPPKPPAWQVSWFYITEVVENENSLESQKQRSPGSSNFWGLFLAISKEDVVFWSTLSCNVFSLAPYSRFTGFFWRNIALHIAEFQPLQRYLLAQQQDRIILISIQLFFHHLCGSTHGTHFSMWEFIKEPALAPSPCLLLS